MSQVTDDLGDGSLLEAFLAGRSGAFELLVRRHETALLRHARSILGDGGAWEDTVQEVFLKLAQNPPTLPPEARRSDEVARSHLAAWLHTVTRNACMDAIRNETRRKSRERQAAEAGAGRVEPEPAADRDMREAVETSLAKLPDDQREVLVLRLLGERSYREIAQITGRKVGTVGWLVSVGLKTLGRDLAPILDTFSPGSTQARSGDSLDLACGEAS